MTASDFWSALLGGALIGAAASLLLMLNGRIAGISGICAGVLVPPGGGERGWRAWFLVGLIGGGLVLSWLAPQLFHSAVESPTALLAAGLLVGVGTRLGSGCTSGHGVCGIARFSPRSLVATLVFIVSGMLTVFVCEGLGS